MSVERSVPQDVVPGVAQRPGKQLTDHDVLVELDRLEAASRARMDELRRIAAELPATMSRRSLATSLVRDAAATPNKGEIARRGALRIAKMPIHVAHRAVQRWRSRTS